VTAPLVSIVIPTFNRLHSLGRALAGVSRQSFRDYEAIVVDDASTDGTAEAVTSLKTTAGLQELTYIRLDANAGAAAARNRGIAAARGEFIALLDADDEWLPAKLERQVECFQLQPDEVGLVTTRYAIVDRSGRIGSEHPRSPEQGDLAAGMARMLSGGGEIVGVFSTLMFRRRVAEAIGGLDETLPCWHDADFYYRAAQRFRFAFLPETLTIKHEPADAISASWRMQVDGQRRFWQKHRVALGGRQDFRRYIASHRRMLGRQACLRGDISTGRQLLVEALAIQPSQWRATVDLVMSLGGSRTCAGLWSLREAVRRRSA
jgi:glycosyltransferase involved in cell wall biosynthesis